MNKGGRIVCREAVGNGRLDAVSNAVKDSLGLSYTLVTYTEHALETSSQSRAAAYVGIETDKGFFWGVGITSDIIDASVKALVSAVNNSGIAG